MTNNQAAKVGWNNTCGDCCGAPGGCGTCMYVAFCPWCAAGEVATAAGRDYCCSCMVAAIPFVGWLIRPIWWSGDRAALAKKYNVQDPYEGCSACVLMALPCYHCLLIQELNHIKAVELRGGLAPAQTTTVVSVPAQTIMKV